MLMASSEGNAACTRGWEGIEAVKVSQATAPPWMVSQLTWARNCVKALISIIDKRVQIEDDVAPRRAAVDRPRTSAATHDVSSLRSKCLRCPEASVDGGLCDNTHI